MKKKEENIGALAFWFIIIAMALIPLLWLQVWGYQNINMRAFVVGSLFVSFIVLTFAFDFSKHFYPAGSTFTENCLSFAIGIVFGTLFGALSAQSIFTLFTVSQQYLLSEITAQLPLFWSTFANTVGAPVAEELLFLVSIPAILFVIVGFVSTRFKLLSNPLLQVAIVAGVVGPLFAFFHVGNVALMGFIISAIFFRILMIGMVHGDMKSDIVPLIALIPSFAIGYHMANNVMAAGGWSQFVYIMQLEAFGWIALLVIFLFMIGGILGAVNLLGKKKKKGKKK